MTINQLELSVRQRKCRKKMIVKGKAYEANIVLNKIELARCFALRKYEIKEAIADLRRDKVTFTHPIHRPLSILC